MAERIFLPPEERSWPDSRIAQKYGISRPTAWRAKTRGWFVRGYHARKPPRVNVGKLDPEKMRKIALSVYRRVILPLRARVAGTTVDLYSHRRADLARAGLRGRYRAAYPYIGPEEFEDLIQEAMLAMVERSGDEVQGDFWNYMWGVARQAMLHYARSGKSSASYGSYGAVGHRFTDWSFTGGAR